jgi:hypothetical protein
MKFDKEATRTDWTPIKRMTACRHKSQAIKALVRKERIMDGKVLPNGRLHERDTVNEAILVGCVSSIAATEDGRLDLEKPGGKRSSDNCDGNWNRCGECPRDFVFYDELSLKTLQKLPAFEKKIYEDYKEECQRKMDRVLQQR